MRYYDVNTDGLDIVSHYYLQDANFNVTAVTDSTGTVVERYSYTPYGEVTVLDLNFSPVTPNESTIANEYLYTGRRLDPETGLQINRRRFYASHLGGWVNRDPIGYAGRAWNLYEYLDSTPSNTIDPFGTCRIMTFAANGKVSRYAKGGYLQGAKTSETPQFNTSGYFATHGEGPTGNILCIKEVYGKGAIDCDGNVSGATIVKRYQTIVSVNSNVFWTKLSSRRIPLPSFFGANISLQTNLGTVCPKAKANDICKRTTNRWTFLSAQIVD